MSLNLLGGKTKQLLLFEKGVISINDIPEEEPQPQTGHSKECIATGRTHIDKSEICRFTSQVNYPAYFLEIKTASPAIPIYDGTRPYQNIPFQFSLHIVEGPGLAPVHYSFLAEGANDPRIRFLEEMSKRLGCHGSIIVDDAQFNTTVLQELAQAFPRYTGWAQDIIARLADLKAPFSNFHYYHPSQKGEATLEKALSVITDAGAKDGLSTTNGCRYYLYKHCQREIHCRRGRYCPQRTYKQLRARNNRYDKTFQKTIRDLHRRPGSISRLKAPGG